MALPNRTRGPICPSDVQPRSSGLACPASPRLAKEHAASASRARRERVASTSESSKRAFSARIQEIVGGLCFAQHTGIFMGESRFCRARPLTGMRDVLIASLLGGFSLLGLVGCARDIRIKDIPGPQVHEAKYQWAKCEDANSRCLEAWEQVSQGKLPEAQETLRALLPHRPLHARSQELHKTAAVYMNMAILAFILWKPAEALLRMRRATSLGYNETEKMVRLQDTFIFFRGELLKTWAWVDAHDPELLFQVIGLNDRRTSKQQREDEKDLLAMASCKPTERWSKERGCEPGTSTDPAFCQLGRFEHCKERCAAGNAESCFRLVVPFASTWGSPLPHHVQLVRRGCGAGSADSCTLLAIFLGTTVPGKTQSPAQWEKSLVEAEQARTRGCEGGSQVACDMQGEFLLP